MDNPRQNRIPNRKVELGAGGIESRDAIYCALIENGEVKHLSMVDREAWTILTKTIEDWLYRPAESWEHPRR